MTNGKGRARLIGAGMGIVCWLASACVSVLALGPEAIAWRTDFPSAELEARAQNRLLWVQFTGSWCPNCVRLERESFVHPVVVGDARSFFVPVKLASEQHEDLVERFGVSGIPATILVKPSGEVVARHEGYIDAAGFHAFLARALIQNGGSPRRVGVEMTRTAAAPAMPRRSLPASGQPATLSRGIPGAVRR